MRPLIRSIKEKQQQIRARLTNVALPHTTYRAAVFKATGVGSVDEIQSPKLLRSWVLPVDETFRALLYRRPYSVNISVTVYMQIQR